MFDNLRNILDFDDLLFAKRNKAYGAYQLRRRYNSVMAYCILLASLIVSLAVLLPFLLTSNSEYVVAGGSHYVEVNMQNLEPPVDQIIIPPAPPPPVVHVQEIAKYIPPVIVDSMPPVSQTLPTFDQLETQTVTDNLQVSGNGSDLDMQLGDGGTASDEPFVFVEVMPSFRGGDIDKFREWVKNRTNYPQQAIDKKLKGTVFLTFIVEKDGSVTNVSVVKGVDPLIDNEAVKAISGSPKWTPGMQRGQPVRVRYQIPLHFQF